MVVNVCPAAATTTPCDRVWSVLTAPERFGEWTDAKFVSADPAGPVKPGQTIRLRNPVSQRNLNGTVLDGQTLSITL